MYFANADNLNSGSRVVLLPSEIQKKPAFLNYQKSARISFNFNGTVGRMKEKAPSTDF